MAKLDKRPKPMARWFAGRLTPATAYDAEALDGYPQGTEFTLTANTKRSLPQHRTYWRALDHAVKATGRWATPEALHTAIKVELGRVEPIFDMNGKVKGMIPESIAFGAMTQQEFLTFFNQAMTVLSEAIGYDALAWLEDRP